MPLGGGKGVLKLKGDDTKKKKKKKSKELALADDGAQPKVMPLSKFRSGKFIGA